MARLKDGGVGLSSRLMFELELKLILILSFLGASVLSEGEFDAGGEVDRLSLRATKKLDDGGSSESSTSEYLFLCQDEIALVVLPYSRREALLGSLSRLSS